MFKEPIYMVMSKIKDKPFFKWPKAIPSDPSRRDPDKFCPYQKDHIHMTKKCKSLKKILEDLVIKGHIQEFVKDFGDQKKMPSSQTRLVINVIHGVLDLAVVRNNAIRNNFQKVLMHWKAFPHIAMSIAAYKRPREGEPHQLSVLDKDLQSVETPPHPPPPQTKHWW